MRTKLVCILFIAMNSTLYSNSYIATSPIFITLLPNKNSLTLEYTLKDTKPLNYTGTVYGSTTNASTKSQTESFGGVYITSSWIDEMRYGLALYEGTNGIHNVWNTADAMKNAKLYETNYTYLKLMACKSMGSDLFIALSLNLTEEKAFKEVQGSTYYANLKGKGIAPWISVAAMYMPTHYSGLFINGSSKATIKLEGTIDGQTPLYSATSSGTLDIIQPSEWMLGGFAYLSENSIVSLGYKKVNWSQRKTEDMQINDQKLEAAFGTPENNTWKDVDIWFVTYKYILGTKSVQLGYLTHNGAHDSTSAYLTNASFGSKRVSIDFETKINDSLEGGIKVSRSFQNGGSIQNNVLNGTINNSTKDYFTIYTQYKW